MAKYMHTLDGYPATFDGYQICYAAYYGKPNKLCESLKQIRQEQEISRRNRKADGFDNSSVLSHRRYD